MEGEFAGKRIDTYGFTRQLTLRGSHAGLKSNKNFLANWQNPANAQISKVCLNPLEFLCCYTLMWTSQCVQIWKHQHRFQGTDTESDQWERTVSELVDKLRCAMCAWKAVLAPFRPFRTSSSHDAGERMTSI